MGFLDNSGDIILDAVLTDEGRRRLAAGDGTFKIAKFALGDDEIDYAQWDSTNASGSSYYDLNILQTPILEAFTNNASSLKYSLVTYTNTNLLYLPVCKLDSTGINEDAKKTVLSLGLYVALVNPDDINRVSTGVYGYSDVNGKKLLDGNIGGTTTGDRGTGICVGQGLDTTDITFTEALAPDLEETKYLIQMDNRLGSLCDVNQSNLKAPAWVDDDNIATYAIAQSAAGDADYFNNYLDPTINDSVAPCIIAGPYNRAGLVFSVFPSDSIRWSNYYFEQFGNTADSTDETVYTTVYSIDTSIRVIGQTTGYRLDIPIRWVKIIKMTAA